MRFSARDKVVARGNLTRGELAGYIFVIVAGVAASGVAVLSNTEAGAMGRGGNPAVMMSPSYEQMQPPYVQYLDVRPFISTNRPRLRSTEQRVATRSKHHETLQTGPAMCVRLCDGAFFPSSTATGGDGACTAQCPDAPTALYIEPPGSGSIEDAVSTSGALYSNLPVAGRYRTILDSTCTCRRDRASYSAMLLRDPTLRKGDAVMTPKGIVVYEGANPSHARREDFVALAREIHLPGEVREYLSEMRSTLVAGGHFSYPAMASTSTALPVVRRGSVRIDGPSASSP